MWTVSEIICLGSLAGLSIADIHYRKVPGEILAMGAVGACVYRICMEQENAWILGGGDCNWHTFPFCKQSYRGEVRVWRQSGNFNSWYLYGDMETSVGIIRCLYAFDHWCSARTEQQENVQKMYTSIFSFFNRRVFVVSGDRTALNRGQNEAYKIKKSKRKYDGRNVTADADHIVSDIKLYINSILFPR